MARLRPQSAMPDAELARRVREWVVTGVHTGRLRDGDRLPSYREVGRFTGADLRAVARAYEQLEGEGLVEVRGRSGVYLAPQRRMDGGVLAETARWMVEVLRGAWTRGIPLHDLSRFVASCTTSTRVRCAFVESTTDQIEAFRAELRDAFGMDAHAVAMNPSGAGNSFLLGGSAELRMADLLATTAFHAAEVRPLAEQMEKEFVTVRVNPAFIAGLMVAVQEGGLTVLCADERFGERIRQLAGDAPAERVRTVVARGPESLSLLGSARRVLVTEAARLALPGLPLPKSYPDEPMIAPESAAELAEVLVRLNLASLRDTGGRLLS